jgi:cytochrome P450
LLGVDYSVSKDIQRFSSTVTSSASSAEELAAANNGLYAILEDVVNEQYENPREGLIGTLIEQSRKGEIEHRQILGQTFITIVAGHETTANTISMGCVQLFDHPDIRARVEGDPSLIPGMVEDMLRMHSLADGVPSRVATADMVIGGQEVKAGDGVIVTLSGPNYDPAVWDEPYELNIDRNSKDHLSFSAGIHSCLGQNLARAELYTVFEQLLRRIPTLRLADVEEPVVMVNDGFVYGVKRLMVDW